MLSDQSDAFMALHFSLLLKLVPCWDMSGCMQMARKKHAGAEQGHVFTVSVLIAEMLFSTPEMLLSSSSLLLKCAIAVEQQCNITCASSAKNNICEKLKQQKSCNGKTKTVYLVKSTFFKYLLWSSLLSYV